MRHFKIYPEHGTFLNLEEEIIITEIIGDIVKQDRLTILAFNICQDHVHLVIACEEEALGNIVQKLKSVSAREFNIWKGVTKPETTARGHDPLPKKGKEQNHLWAQKFFSLQIEDETRLINTISYIQHNREKHKLSRSKKIEALIRAFVKTY